MEMGEGSFFCRWLKSRLISNNKNVIGVELGSTGSGKSYRDLKKAELWYNFHFKKPFPPENICFGTLRTMERISSGELKRGDLIIFEEAGVNLGSLDFQSRVSKMFTYVLQSFRSMNIGLFMNLPYLSMLNKTARMLLHYSSESAGIDFETNISRCKLFIHQVNQKSGKIYMKYPKVRAPSGWKKLKRINYSLPSKDLIQHYESKKTEYLSSITSEYVTEMKKLEDTKKPKRKELEPHLLEVYTPNQNGLNQYQIAEQVGKTQQAVSGLLKTCRKLGYEVKKC